LRVEAVRALGSLKGRDAQVAQLLIDMSDDGEARRLQREVLPLLPEYVSDTDKVVSLLIRRLAGPDDEIASAAAWTLGEMGTAGRGALPALQIAADPRSSDRYPSRRVAAQEAIEKIEGTKEEPERKDD
jgi:hypothetical protein